MKTEITHMFLVCVFGTLCGAGAAVPRADADTSIDPYTLQGQAKIEALRADDAPARSRAAEALGYMRYYPAEAALIDALRDVDAVVRRNAVLALGWCGGRRAVMPLVERLDDSDWTVRQSAWVALTNITGMEHPFDALAERADRLESAGVWRAWCNALPERGLPAGVLELMESERHIDVQRGVRAAGALGGGDDLVARIEQAVGCWAERNNENDAAAKWRVQAGIRALGRLGHPEALPLLVRFLHNTQWSRYAADALGDLGGEEAAAALLAAFPSYARPAGPGLFRDSTHRAPGTHPSDVPHADSRDRILAASYAIAQSLSRIPFDDSDSLEVLRGHVPLLLAQIPLDIDGLMVYDEEPFQRIFRYLVERAGLRGAIVDAAFASLGQPRADTGKAEAADTEKPGNRGATTRSPVLRGRDAPHRLEANVEGWIDLYLVVDDVDDYYQDRANWAEAKLIDRDGRETFLDTLEPVSAQQQHDTLRINESATFGDLRIGDARFDRGLHTHAVSVIRYKLDGRYRRFEAQVGVCASRTHGQGSVRFIVSRDPVKARVVVASLPAPVDAAYASNVILALCRDAEHVPRLVALMDHENHWVRINATRTLMFMDAHEAVAAIGERLMSSPPEASFGFFNARYFARAQGQDEFNDPTPRYREAFIMALGHFRAEAYAPLLAEILFDENNALGIRYRAANALDRIGTPEAIEALREAEFSHPYHSVRMVAREALWRRGLAPQPRPEPSPLGPPLVAEEDIPERPTRFVFIKGDPAPYNPFQMDSWRQTYLTTDSGPTYRPGRNLYILDISGGHPEVTPLTTFDRGYVADCEVSYDGQTLLFARRTGDSPWWHVYEIGADGAGLRQLTDGPYHDVQPTPMPNGRIAFSTTRLGTRDEYHGYLCTGLATMHPDGSDIQVIGMNFGRDAEPSIADDGRILFTRLELFYSRMKTEFNLIAAHPDGTRMHTLYGPERRDMWGRIHGGYGNWFAGGVGGRHRHLRLTQPRAFGPGEYLLTTPAGPILTQGRRGESFLRQSFLQSGGNDPWVVTTPYPLDGQTLLVAAGMKNHAMVRAEFPTDEVDLGLYTMCVSTGELTLLYNDPEAPCFEARPLQPRHVPPVLAESAAARGSRFTGLLYAQSAFISQEPHVPERGRLLRVVEALPQVTRHATHTTPREKAWKNHGGAFGRDLAVLPLAADGSFVVEAPADRFLHLQVLDSDRNVVGNQLNWMHLRPGEAKGCVGCHEPPHAAPLHGVPLASANMPAFRGGAIPRALPDGPDQFRYRAKIWFKGHTPDEREERQRTVQSINWFGRQ